MQDSISEEKASDKKSDRKSDRKSDKKADVTDKEDTPMIKPNYEKNMKKSETGQGMKEIGLYRSVK